MSETSALELVQNKVDEDLVASLERCLEQAKAGNVRNMVLAYEAGTKFRTAYNGRPSVMLGHLARLTYELNRDMDE